MVLLYENGEYFDMVGCYFQSSESYRAAAEMYAERFPNQARQPDKNVIKRAIFNLRENGSFARSRRKGLDRPVLNLRFQKFDSYL